MSDAILVAIITAAATIIGAYLSFRSAFDKKNRQDAIKEAQREQHQQDEFEAIKQKLDIHNGYAEKLGAIQLDIAGIHKDIEYINKKIGP